MGEEWVGGKRRGNDAVCYSQSRRLRLSRPPTAGGGNEMSIGLSISRIIFAFFLYYFVFPQHSLLRAKKSWSFLPQQCERIIIIVTTRGDFTRVARKNEKFQKISFSLFPAKKPKNSLSFYPLGTVHTAGRAFSSSQQNSSVPSCSSTEYKASQ